MTFEVLEHSVVLAHAGVDRIAQAVESAKHFGMRSQHYGWPGLTRTRDGEILVAASERIRHVDPFGREVLCRSADGGRTWSKPEVFFNSNTDDRDAGLCVLPDGTVVATWFSSSAWTAPNRMIDLWQDMRAGITDDTLAALSRGWLRRSHDGGRTWEPRVYPTIVGLHAGPSVCANGDLIYCGPYEEQRFVCTRSTDGGKTWAIIGEIPVPHVHVTPADNRTDTRLDFNENHVLEVAPGRLLCALRRTSLPRTVHVASSNDGGVTWGKPVDLGVHGFPPTLLRLQSGAVLCVYADRGEPQSIRGVLSHDRGETWDTANELLIRRFEHKADMGYPTAIEVSPGEILCVYYYMPHPYPGQPSPSADHTDPAEAGILATRFRLT